MESDNLMNSHVTQRDSYFAFISYKREDEKWAKWLTLQLENYHLPAFLKDESLPKNLRPVFRDVDELCAGNLPSQIYQALSRSKNLIVICSPKAAHSKWVDKEIRDFIDINHGSSESIFPFIVEGIPFSADKECFPATLVELGKDRERVGANVNEPGGREAAVVKTIAGLLGVGFDLLWQRRERELKRRRLLRITVLLLIATISLGLAGLFYMQNQELKRKEWRLMTNQARAVTEKANQLIDDGNALTAVRILMQIIPNEDRSRPFLPESEVALRRAVDSLNQGSFSSISLQKASTSDIKVLQLSLDGSLLATGDETGEIRIWDVNGSAITLRHTLKSHKSMVSCLRFNDSGTKMLSGSWDRSAILWDIETGKALNVFPGKEWVFDVSFYNAENNIAVSSNIVQIWSAEQNEVVDSLFFDSDGYFIRSFEISKDYKRALVATGSSLILYDLEENRIITKMSAREGEFSSVRWSENESTVIAVLNPNLEWSDSMHKWGLNDKKPSVYIIDANTFSVRREEKRFNDTIESVRFCENDNAFITTTSDGDITLWDVDNQGLFSVFRNFGRPVIDAVPLITGDFISTDESSLRTWKKVNSVGRYCLENQLNDLSSITLSNDGSLASTNGFYGTKIWQLPDWDLLASVNVGQVLQPHSAFTPDNGFFALTNSQDSVITIIDITTGDSIELTGHSKNISSLCFSPDGEYLASSSFDNTVILWDWKNKNIKRRLEGNNDFLHVCFSPDGNYIASSSRDQSIYLWHTSDYEMHSLNYHEGTVFCTSFSRDGKYLASVDGKGFVVVWDLKTFTKKWSAYLDGLGLRHVEFSPVGHCLLCSTTGRFYIIDVEDGTVRYKSKSMELLSNAYFSKGGDRILVPTAYGNVRDYHWDSIRELMDRMSIILSDSRPFSEAEKSEYYLDD